MSRIEEILEYLNPDFLELYPFISSEIERINTTNIKELKTATSENQTLLITYADQFQAEGESNFKTLDQFLEEDLEGVLSHVHILPFYPWTSDDGFSPVNYHEVCSDYGQWSDVESIKTPKMFDCVFNHLSSENEFFQKALSGDKKSQDMFHFISKDEYETQKFQENIPLIVRPRISPLFTPYKVKDETKYVWTTFSADQVDTNISNPDMLKYLLESFFLYIDKGAKFFRVDAIPFMWKELGTNCSHLEKTHKFVQLLRAITDEVKTDLHIITESNVPHTENITYWGNGTNEAHLIYNFSLAPLVLHALHFQTNEYLNKWGSQVFDIHESTSFLNFTATHDGIGLRGLEGIVPETDVKSLCDKAESLGGYIAKKRSRDGTEKPYELNITWASIMEDSNLSIEHYITKLVNSQAIVMFMPGITAHYVHNFLGTKNWTEGYEESGIPRRLNRKKLNYPIDYTDISIRVKNGLLDLIKEKNSHECFSAGAKIEFFELSKNVLSFRRSIRDEVATIYYNLTSLELSLEKMSLNPFELRIEYS